MPKVKGGGTRCRKIKKKGGGAVLLPAMGRRKKERKCVREGEIT